MNAAQTTHSDDMLNAISRRVFYKALTRIESMLDSPDSQSPDRMMAYAQVADSAACGFKPETQDGEEAETHW